MQQRHPTVRRSRRWPWLAAGATLLTLGLAACDRLPADEPTVGQRIDKTIEGAERKADEVRADVTVAATQARRDAAQVAGSAGKAIKDAAITAAVTARLAGDKTLSAMRIDVDTDAGRVKLEGQAPSGEARNRASALAASVDGVVAVDNRLSVASGG